MNQSLAICNAQIFNGYQLIEADTILCDQNKIKTIGTYKDLKNTFDSSTKIIDAANQFVMPAFIEGHGHFANLGFSKMKVDCSCCKNWKDIVGKVQQETENKRPDTWIEGEGWHQEKWDVMPKTVQGFPTNRFLNEYIPNHPVVLWHASKHAAILNQVALQLVFLNEDSMIEGGQLIKDTNGNLTGMLIENAIKPVHKTLQHYHQQHEKDRFYKAIELASDECLQHGITLFQDADIRLPDFEKYSSKKGQHKLKVDLWMLLHETKDHLKSLSRFYPYTQGKITIGGIKRYMDGAIGNHGAWFIEPYLDKPDSNGHCTLNLEEYEDICAFAAQHNLQMATHAIGDMANRKVLQIYDKYIQQFKLKDHRWRIEHAQHLHPEDIAYFKKNQILASVQTNHCTSDAGYVEKRLGKQRVEQGAYLWQSLIQQNVRINNGTDCPIESINPIENFYAAVTRKPNNHKAFYPKECLTPLQALQAYTINNAYAAKLEKQTGSLEIGKKADMVLLSKNLLTIPEEEILQTEVILTVKDGLAVYDNIK